MTVLYVFKKCFLLMKEVNHFERKKLPPRYLALSCVSFKNHFQICPAQNSRSDLYYFFTVFINDKYLDYVTL